MKHNQFFFVLSLLIVFHTQARDLDKFKLAKERGIDGVYEGTTVVNGWYKKGACEVDIVTNEDSILISFNNERGKTSTAYLSLEQGRSHELVVSESEDKSRFGIYDKVETESSTTNRVFSASFSFHKDSDYQDLASVYVSDMDRTKIAGFGTTTHAYFYCQNLSKKEVY